MTEYFLDIESLMAELGATDYNGQSLDALICNGLSEDSRKLQPGDLFIARPGIESDGRRYINQAVSKGAIAVLAEAHELEQFVQAKSASVRVYQLAGLGEKLGEVADKLYQHPSQSLKIVGITGTNGKTSCSQLIAQVLDQFERKVAVMGTLGNGLVHQLHKTDNTTVDAISMHQTLAGFAEREVSHVCMEVSSHALTQGRVNGVLFNTAVFTNLTRDHLDYHGTMEEYLEAKKQLLIRPELQNVIINGDDAYGNRLLDDETIMADKFSFSITPVNARIPERSVWTERVEFKDTGMEADVTTPWGNVTFETHLIGQFNLSNCLAVLTTLGAMGYDIEQVAAKLANLKSVSGRMERFGGEDKPMVIVDYAHTPDALSHVLAAIKPHTSHRLWCIFGCGGDRDRGKRPLMAKAAEQYADYVVITSDNPRSEPVETITQEIIEGLENPAKCEIEYDRERAIQSAISRAVLGDVVLVAGKGHEDYQVIGDERRPFSDAEVVKLALSKGSWS